jgi:hypothetical protein
VPLSECVLERCGCVVNTLIADQLIGRPCRAGCGSQSKGCVAYWAALRRAHACVYPSVRRGRLSLPRFEAAPPMGLP